MLIREKLVINTAELGNKLPKLIALFRYSNPAYYQKQMMKITTAGIEPTLYHYALEDGPGGKQLFLPRGGIEKVRAFFKENNLPLRILDQRVTNPTLIDFTLRGISKKTGLPFILSDKQEHIIEELISNEGGLIQAMPGFGKSLTMLGLISRVKQPTLILMHEHRLRSQWEAEIKDKIDGSFTLGRLDGDKKEDGDVVVGLFQTATKLIGEDPEWFNKFGMVITDEVQHSSSETFNKLITNIPAKYRIGVSGTIKRSDGLELLIFDTFGRIIVDIPENQAKERIVGFEPLMFYTGIDFNLPIRYTYQNGKRDTAYDHTKTLNVLTENEERNALIIKNVIKDIEEGHYPLIISDRVEHCEKLYETLTDIGYKGILLISKTRKKVKWEVVKEDNTIQFISAIGKIASEGLDLPRLSSIHLTCPTTNESQIRQKIARVRRYMEGKPLPKVWDYVDNGAFYWRKDSSGEKVKNFTLKRKGDARRLFYKRILEEYAEA